MLQETTDELEVRKAWETFNLHFKKIFLDIVTRQKLSMSLSWELGYKAIGEIGGRLLEDFFVSKFEEENRNQDFIFFEPVHARSMGDIKCLYKQGPKEFVFFIDIKCNYIHMREKTLEYYQKKGINKKKPGQSHPNIMSVEKLKIFVENQEHRNSDVAMLFIKYDIDKDNEIFSFKVNPNLDQKCFFLIRDVGDSFFDVGNLGKGQLQMSKLDNLEFTKRGKKEFLEIVLRKRIKDRIKRPTQI